MATVMLTSRHLYRYRFTLARTTMRLAALPLLLFSAIVACLSFFLGDWLGVVFSDDAEVIQCVSTLTWYIGPMVLLKASSGLHGQYLAVTGRGVVGTYLLLIVPWGMGIPASYAWASLHGGGARSLLFVHTCAWLLTASVFAILYSRATPTSRQPLVVAPPARSQMVGTSRSSSSRAPSSSCSSSLAAPLLQGSAPAP